jgi:hypothetical protein
MYAVAWAIGPLLLPFVALYAASLAGLVWLAASVPVARLPDHVTPGFPRRSTIAFAVVMAVLLVGMWLPLLAAVLGGELEGNLHGQTTLVVQALDLGLVVPLALTTAALLWRRRPAGYLLATTVVVKGLAMATAITAMVLMAWYVEGELGVAELAIFVAAAAACAVLLVAMSRAVTDEVAGAAARGDADATPAGPAGRPAGAGG